MRRVWKCAKCRKQLSMLTGTIFHGTKVSLRTWSWCRCPQRRTGFAREVERMYGVTPETAWFVLHRLREAMKRDPLAGLLAGTVMADETWIGGKPEKHHPTPEERDGPVVLPLPPDVAIPAILATGLHPDEDDAEAGRADPV